MMEFARRGWAMAAVLRRGYGQSGGGWAESFGPCDNANYIRAGRAGADDLRAAFAYLSHRADVDPRRMIAVGVSAGGFATVALTENPPPGLLAAISFAGGRGSESADNVCMRPGPDRSVPHVRVALPRAAALGLCRQRSFLRPDTRRSIPPGVRRRRRQRDLHPRRGLRLGRASALLVAGQADLGADCRCVPDARTFAPRKSAAAALCLPPLAPPRQLSASGRKDFAAYLAAFPRKAFAISPNGAYGWRTARRSDDEAKSGALGLCGAHASTCHVYAVDDGVHAVA